MHGNLSSHSGPSAGRHASRPIARLRYTDYEKGQQLVESKEFARFQKYFRAAFEIARRHKIMNPG